MISPEALASILDGQRPELSVHFLVEVLPEEERPEPEECVHLLRLSAA